LEVTGPKNILAVIIITRNEAQHIGRCLASVLREVQNLPDTEVMLVDSASTDGTIDIAREFPISIIQLQPHWPLTPGAGRYLGTQATSGEYVLFLDGDTELYPVWLPEALDFLHRHPEAGGVGGTRDEFYITEQGHLTGEVLHRYQVQQVTEVRTLGGDGLYRRTALDKVGTFHPYLALYEEAELALRLRKAGYTLWRLPLPMVRHFSPPRGTLQEAVRRFRVGFYPRAGQTLRATFKNGLGGQFIREFLMNYVITGAYLVIGLMTLIAAPLDNKGLIAWLACSAAIFVAYLIRKKSLRGALNGFIARLMVLYGLVVGFFTTELDVDQYPRDVIVVQRQKDVATAPGHISGKPVVDTASPE